MKTSTEPTAVCDLPPPTPDEYRARLENIRQHGILDAVHVNERGMVIDGLTRQRIAAQLGITFRTKVHKGLADEEKRALRRSLNLARRQLTNEQKRRVILDQLRDTPRWSNRRIAHALGVSHPTVAAARNQLEATGKITSRPATEGRDGKVRRNRGRGEAATITIRDFSDGTPSPPKHAERRTRLIHGQCPDALAPLARRSVDLVVSAPPVPVSGRASEAAWLATMKATATECRRVLKPAGSMVWIVRPDSSKDGRLRTWHLEFAVWAARELEVVQDAYWFDPTPMPGGVEKGLLHAVVGWCLWLGKTNAYRNRGRVRKTPYDLGHGHGEQRHAGLAIPVNLIEVARGSGSSDVGD